MKSISYAISARIYEISGLTELLAEQTTADPEQRARVLNRFYDTALEAAELRFRGYNTAADLLGFD